MAFKDTWKPRIDGVDDADSSAVNEIAEEVIRQADEETNIKQSVNEINEDVKTLQDDVDNLKENPTAPIIDAYAKQEANNLFANAFKGVKSGVNMVEIDDVSPIEHNVVVEVTAPNMIPVDISNYDTPVSVGGLTVQSENGRIRVHGITNGVEAMSGATLDIIDLPAGTYTFSYTGSMYSAQILHLIQVFFEITNEDGSEQIDIIQIDSDNDIRTVTFDESIRVYCFLHISQDFTSPMSGVDIDTTFLPTINSGDNKSLPITEIEYIVVGNGVDEVEPYHGNIIDNTYRAIVKPIHPYMFVSSTPQAGYEYKVTYNKDSNAVLSEIDKALDTIIAQQESIIEIQDALIGGGNE